MSVRKRRWTTQKDEAREAWVVSYTDAGGARRLKTFQRKKAADAFEATTKVQIRQGIHVADAASVTVAVAGGMWLAAADAANLERTTVDQYRQHLNLHIKPFIGRTLLSRLNAPAVRTFEDRLREKGRSPAMIKRVRTSLSAILAEAQELGLVARNAVKDLRRNRRRGADRRQERRRREKLVMGVDIPTPAEIKLMVDAAAGRWKPLVITAILAGLRASELRGLPWTAVDLAKRELHVRQRADRYNVIGPPKSEAARRTIPLPSSAVNALREWSLRCPKGEQGLVFPNGKGHVESYANITHRGIFPLLIAAGVTKPKLNAGGKPVLDDDGKSVLVPKYTGLHALRHFYASWLINRPTDGGLGLPPKVVQERLGHASITMTYDVYGHLFPRGDDAAELDAAERALLG